MSDLVTLTKSHLKRFVPDAKDISIKIERDHELYRSQIHVNAPGAVLHAEKRAETVWEALDSSCQAVLKQIKRLKTKKQFKGKLNKAKWHELLMPPP